MCALEVRGALNAHAHNWDMMSAGERAAYWRVPGLALEAMDARFEHYAYPMHAHDTYSFGVTDDDAQSFVCGGSDTSARPG